MKIVGQNCKVTVEFPSGWSYRFPSASVVAVEEHDRSGPGGPKVMRLTIESSGHHEMREPPPLTTAQALGRAALEGDHAAAAALADHYVNDVQHRAAGVPTRDDMLALIADLRRQLDDAHERIDVMADQQQATYWPAAGDDEV